MIHENSIRPSVNPRTRERKILTFLLGPFLGPHKIRVVDPVEELLVPFEVTDRDKVQLVALDDRCDVPRPPIRRRPHVPQPI